MRRTFMDHLRIARASFVLLLAGSAAAAGQTPPESAAPSSPPIYDDPGDHDY